MCSICAWQEMDLFWPKVGEENRNRTLNLADLWVKMISVGIRSIHSPAIQIIWLSSTHRWLGVAMSPAGLSAAGEEQEEAEAS